MFYEFIWALPPFILPYENVEEPVKWLVGRIDKSINKLQIAAKPDEWKE